MARTLARDWAVAVFHLSLWICRTSQPRLAVHVCQCSPPLLSCFLPIGPNAEAKCSISWLLRSAERRLSATAAMMVMDPLLSPLPIFSYLNTFRTLWGRCDNPHFTAEQLEACWDLVTCWDSAWAVSLESYSVSALIIPPDCQITSELGIMLTIAHLFTLSRKKNWTILVNF